MILSAIAVTAAGSSPVAGVERGAPSLPVQQRPVFEATVSRVQVDAIVTDGSGRFVADLTSSDFIVYEDGEPQPLLDVQLIDLATGSVIDLGNPAGAADTPPSVTTAAADSATDYGALVFLIDGPSLDLKTRRRFALAWEELLTTTESLRVPRAVYLVDSFGALDELVPLTLETDPLFEAVETVRTTTTPGNSMKRKFYELLNTMSAPEAIDAARQQAALSNSKRRSAAWRPWRC